MADKENNGAAKGGKDVKDAKGAKDAAAGTAAPAAAPPARKGPALLKNKKLIIIAAAAVLLLGGGGAAAWVFLGGEPEATAQVGADGKEDPDAAKKAKRKRGTPVFVDLETFTANLRDADDDRFIQVKLVAEVSDAPAGEMLKTLMPTVRNEILLLLGSKESADLATREGKEKLAAEIVQAANHTLEETPHSGAVQGVNFTHIIVQ
jgi:flagellar FliL protein